MTTATRRTCLSCGTLLRMTNASPDTCSPCAEREAEEDHKAGLKRARSSTDPAARARVILAVLEDRDERIDRLALACGVTTRTVREDLLDLIASGHVERARKRGGSRYWRLAHHPQDDA